MKIEHVNFESLRSRKFVNKLYLLHKSLWMNRPYFMLFFLVPIPVLILSITLSYRLPLISKATEEIKSALSLRGEIERAKAATSEKEMEIAVGNWEAVRKRVPGNYETVSDWISDLNSFISLRDFKVSGYNLGELKPAYKGTVGLSLLPINLKLTVQEIDENQMKPVSTGTIQFVELLHEMVESYYGVDLAGLVVTGIGNGINVIDVSINLWVGF